MTIFRAAGAKSAVLSLLFAAVLAVGGAYAQTPMPMPGMPGMPGMQPMGPMGMNQVQLSARDIENFIALDPEMDALSERYGNRNDDAMASNPAEAMAAFQQSQAALAEMNALLNAHGFTDMNHWIAVAYSIALAHNWEQDGADPLQKIDEAIAQLSANPSMNPQQRGYAIAALQSQRAALAAMQPSPENVALVKQYDRELTQVLNE